MAWRMDLEELSRDGSLAVNSVNIPCLLCTCINGRVKSANAMNLTPPENLIPDSNAKEASISLQIGHVTNAKICHNKNESSLVCEPPKMRGRAINQGAR